MDHELNQISEQSTSATPQREWVEPTFERMTLKEAMSFAGPGSVDFYLYS